MKYNKYELIIFESLFNLFLPFPFPSAPSLPTTHPFFICLSGYPTSLGSIIIYNYAVEPTLHLVLNLSFISGFEGYLGQR